MLGKARVVLLVLLFLAAAGISGLLWLQHHGEGEATALTSQICGESTASGESGCGAVNQSAYSEVKGIPLAAAGLFYSLSLGLLLALGLVAGPRARLRAGRIAFVLAALALLIDLGLFAVQAFMIGAFCKLCLATYVINVLALMLLWPARPGAPEQVDPQLVPAPSDSRVLLAGWALGSAAVALAIFAGELTLEHRQNQRAISILGSPTALSAAPEPAPVAQTEAPGFGAQSVHAAELSQSTPPSDTAKMQEDLDKARAEAARLQQILDDPQKLQQYYADKAIAEFDKSAPQNFDLTESPLLGTSGAPIQVVEFSDVLCPHCRQLAHAFDNYLPQSNKRVAVYFKHYPLEQSCNSRIARDIHPGACALALGLYCAQKQGKFEPLYKKAFEGQAPTNPQAKDVVQMAIAAGLDGAQMETCLASPEAISRIKADIEEAGRAEVTGTPTLFINGKRLGNLNFFLQTIEHEAQRLGLPAVAPQAP